MSEAALVAEILDQAKYRQIYTHAPYDWQKQWHNAGGEHKERLLMAANGVGKTITGGYETACHATGEYPDWWKGHRFDRPVEIWVGSISNQGQKDAPQPILLGPDLSFGLGTGMIPKSKIVGKPKVRQAGISDVCDTVKIKHASGGLSTIQFKTYEQGWRLWQAGAPDIIWADEQMNENSVDEKPIFSEMQTRVFRSGGIMYFTLTPLLGETDFIRHFTEPKAKGIYWQGATWDDAPHLGEEDKERLRATYKSYELDARTKGIPMLGSGRVFEVDEKDITVDAFPIPAHFARICGIDFGIDHPAAGVWLAWDRDRDILFLYDCYKRADTTPDVHVPIINKRGKWIPVSWPHDGLKRGQADGKELQKQYRDEGANMLPISACYDEETLGAQPVEPIIQEINQRMKDGRFKVFKGLEDFFREFRSFHRKDGVLVKVGEDVIKATTYAAMMRRYAKTGPSPRIISRQPAAVRL